MQTKALFATLFITLAMALPSPAAEVKLDAAESKAKNIAASAKDGDVSIMAQKTWQAAGGCETKYSSSQTCLAQCIYEADYFSPPKCRGWDYMTGVRTGGCVIGWYTCQCVCEY
ncbi:hypothetical protein QBC35DRAFT_543019 [Podospora australis]|uniref:Uncharacterized protein n=1 Tax=Podospora australis TaxID=1536484 RepID=A0AAN7AEZ7_9PEZI|nr:hypothetical protein QBC35DRAFT_543019 [Podospora australis]